MKKSILRTVFYKFSKTGLAILLLVAALLTIPTPAFAKQSLTCATLPHLFRAYLASHYKSSDKDSKIIDQALKDRTVEVYVKSLDPSKVLFLKKEIKEIRTDVYFFLASAQKSNCKTLYKINDRVVKRIEENELFVKKYVEDSKYKFDENIKLVLDPDDRKFSISHEERKKLLVKMIQFQISNYLSAGSSLEESRKFLVHRYELMTRRSKETDTEDLLSYFMNSFARSLDPHSSYLSRDVLEDFQISMSLSLEGIGVSLSYKDGYTTVEDIIPGGAADRINILKPKDKIISVAQDGQKPVSVIDMALRDVVRLIRGKKGTKVILGILRKGKKTDKFDVAINRDKIDLNQQAASLKIEKRKVDGRELSVGIIDLPSFYGDDGPDGRSAYKDIKKLLVEVKQKKLDGVVLDLSRNGGGLLRDAVRISGLFIPKGGVVATKSSQGTEVLKDEDASVDYDGPLVVLTSRLSASASEILAGALKDYGRAVVVGDDHTFGKGTVQSVMKLPEGLGAIKVTVGMFFLPKGASTQGQGVSSHIEVPTVYSYDKVGESSLDYALAPQEISSFVSPDGRLKGTYPWIDIQPGVFKKLAMASKARIKKSDEFKKVLEDRKSFQKEEKIVSLAELRKKDKESKEKEAKEIEKNSNPTNVENDVEKDVVKTDSKKKDEPTPQLLEAVNILADLIHFTKPTKVVAGHQTENEG